MSESQHPQKSVHETIRELTVMHTLDKILLVRALRERFGNAVDDVVATAVANKERKRFEGLPIPKEERTIERLIDVLWEPFRAMGMEYTMERTPDGVQMRCRACPGARLYDKLGAKDVGFLMCCAADEALTEGFNPNIGFRRTRTLMEGHDECDHFYYYKQPQVHD